MVKGRNGVMAIDVTGPCGSNVVGSRYAANKHELNPRNHLSRLGGHIQRRDNRGDGELDYQSSVSHGGAGRKHFNDRTSSHYQDQGHQPRQIGRAASHGAPKDYRHNTSGCEDNRRGRHATVVTRKPKFLINF